LVLALVWLAACSVPLAPGYEVEKETLDVLYVSGDHPHLAIRAAYQLRNVGNAPLSSIEVSLPDERTFGRHNLSAEVDGRPGTTAPAPAERESGPEDEIFRISIEPVWPQKQKRNLVLEYRLDSGPPGRAAIAVDAVSFHLQPQGWFPELQTPKKLFSHDIERPDPTPVNIIVPPDFLVISTGASVGARKQGEDIEHRFVLHKRNLNPFIVAGRYHQQEVNAPEGDVVFWTFAPIPAPAFQAAGTRIAATLKVYADAFGPIRKKSVPVHIVETSAHLYGRSATGERPAGWPFLNGVLLNKQTFALGISSDGFLVVAEHELAHTWLGEQVRLRPEAEIGMGEGFAEYAPIVATEARDGEAARTSAVRQRLKLYDDARVVGVGKPLSAIRAGDPWEQRKIAYAKGSLLFIALEDECGQAGARRGIAQLIRALRGESAGFEDLRSAMELETGKNLAEFFRIWLNDTGVPDSFRERYSIKQ
jgi:Peptidase family M1 domain